LDVVINAAGGSDTIQLIGRALRVSEGKNTAIVVDFIDNQHQQLYRQSMARMKKCQKVKEFNVEIIGDNKE